MIEAVPVWTSNSEQLTTISPYANECSRGSFHIALGGRPTGIRSVELQHPRQRYVPHAAAFKRAGTCAIRSGCVCFELWRDQCSEEGYAPEPSRFTATYRTSIQHGGTRRTAGRIGMRNGSTDFMGFTPARRSWVIEPANALGGVLTCFASRLIGPGARPPSWLQMIVHGRR